MERFCCKTQICAGSGAVAQLKTLGIRRLFLVTDPFFAKAGTAQRIARLSEAETVEIFDQVTPDPTVELVARGTGLLRAFQPDALVALGGGSALDCGKAMAYFSGLKLRLVAIPTTSGSGSEVTDFAILTHGGVKHPLVDERLRPDVAILDEELVRSLSPKLVADGGFDVLSHALESFVAKNAGTMSDALARDSFVTAFGALPASFTGCQTARGKLHRAATMAGLSFTHGGLGLCHALSHSLGGMFHLPHGRLNAILLPAVISCNAHGAGAKYAKLARSAGLGGSAETVAVRNLKNALIRLRRELQMPETLAQAGIAPGQVRSRTPELVKSTLEDPCCATNPVPVEAFMVRQVLEEVTGRV